MENNIERGNYGEDIALQYILAKKYEILEIKYRCPFSEIDIIAKDESYVVFIEVKYRTSLKYGYPREAVGRKKQLNIRRAALFYIAQKQESNRDFRFDVIEILDMDQIVIEHIENAFY